MPRWATIFVGKNFTAVSAESGRGLTRVDHKAFSILLDGKPSSEDLGKAIYSALSASRCFETTEAFMTFIKDEEVSELHQDWIDKIVEKYGYKSEKELFKSMHNPSVEEENGIIEFGPTRQTNDGYNAEGIKLEDTEKITAPFTTDYETIGERAYEAIDRCR